MILGYTPQLIHVIYGGIVAFLLVGFQILVGLRKIKFKGRKHQKVHKWGGWVLAGVGAVHGFLALAVYNGWSILS